MKNHRHGIALAAALMALGTAAQAQDSSVQVYGLIDALARHASNAGSPGQYMLSDGAYTGSRLGFRGREDLGGGLRAFFSLEQGIDPSTGTLQQSTATAGLGQAATTGGGRAFGREALVGLGTPWGTLTAGRQYTEAHLMSGRFQPQANPNEAAISVLSGHHVARQDNMIRYAFQNDSFSVATNVVANEGNGKAYGASASYKFGPVDLVAYGQDMKTNAAGSDTRRIRGAGGNVAIGKDLKVYLGWMRRDQTVSVQRNNVVTAGFNYNLTSTLVWTGQYIDDKQTGTGVGHRKVAYTGVNWLLSKRSDVYLLLDQNKVDGLYPLPSFMAARGTQNGFGLGLRHRF